MPNIIFLLSITGAVAIFLRRFPEVAQHTRQEPAHDDIPVEQKLEHKGLPTVTILRVNAWCKFWMKKIWNFALEAKDLKPNETTGYQIKKLFQYRVKQRLQQKTSQFNAAEPAKTEEEILESIKKDPKSLSNYDELAKFYINKNNFQDAKDIYRYLVKHDPASADYQARLAVCYYRLEDFANSVTHFEKSLALDSTQPNRYYNLGLAYDSLKKYDSSVQAFKKCISLENQNSKYYFALGNAYEKLNDKEAAIKAFKEAKKLDPQNRQIFERLKNLI